MFGAPDWIDGRLRTLAKRVGHALWVVNGRLASRIELEVRQKATVIIPTYSAERVRGVAAMVRSVLRCAFVEKVNVSNHNPDIRIEAHVRCADERLMLANQPTRRGCGYQWTVASSVAPQYLISIDDDLRLRPAQLALAKQLNPAIRYAVHDGCSTLADGEPPGLISTVAVFSSIRGVAGRRCLADQVVEALPPGGHLFYFDLFRATDFAGRDRIRPARLFAACRTVWHRRFWGYEFIPRRERVQAVWTSLRSAEKRQLYQSLRARLVQRLMPSYEVLCCRKPGGAS